MTNTQESLALVAAENADLHEQMQTVVDGTDPGPLAEAMHSDERTLYRYLRARGWLTGERARIAAGAAAMLTDIDRKLSALDYVFGTHAEQTTRKVLQREGSKAKHIKTPYGNCKFRNVPGGLTVTDQDALLQAVTMGLLPAEIARHRHTIDVNMTALKKLHAETGEIPEGCELKPATERFYIEQ